MINLVLLLQQVGEKGGSDLHLVPGSSPRVRVDGRLVSLSDVPVLPEDTQHLVGEWLSSEQQHRLHENKEVDASLDVEDIGRFRIHVYRQRGVCAWAFRSIPTEIPTLAQLGLPPNLEGLLSKPQGLILITGPAGSGKSTTLAAMLDKLNAERRLHILTLEDPIEFLHSPQKSLVSQREIGTDTPDFLSGLRSALRQDPDLVFLGELRDRETVEAAITIAETGHLTFATLHTNSCIQTLHRIVDVFPASQQAQVRAQLALVVEGIISQALLPKADGKGRALALEVLLPTPAIRNLIRDDKIHQIYSVMQTGQAKHGMQTMNQALLDLAKRRIISPAVALARSRHPEELRGMIERAGSALRSGGTHITG